MDNELSRGRTRMTLISDGSRLLRDLTKQKELRILVDHGNGMGHQSSSVQLARRLISLSGLTAESPVQVTIVYAGDSVRQKVENLLPGGRISGIPYTLRSLEEIKSASWIDFGFTGASDRASSEDMTVLLKARYVLKMQPFRWFQDEVIQCNDSTVNAMTTDIIGSHPLMSELDYENSWYPHEEVPPPDWRSPAQNIQDLKCILDAVMASRPEAGASGRRILLWPVYGLGGNNPLGPHSRRLLRNMIRTVALAREQANWKGSVLIVDLSKDRDPTEWAELKDDVADHSHVFVQGVQTVDYVVRWLKDWRWRSPSIAVCQVGGTKPSDLLRHVWSVADLPPVFEGQGTASEVVPMGAPFLKISMRYMARTAPPHGSIVRGTPKPSDFDYILLQGFEDQARQWQEAANSLIEDSFTPRALVPFIQEALDGESDSWEYFREIAKNCLDISRNRLLLATGLLAQLKTNSKLRKQGVRSMVRYRGDGRPEEIASGGGMSLNLW